MKMQSPKVIFFRVKDNQAKVVRICHLVQELVDKDKKILITVPNEEAAKFIDTLLWRTPEESFLPHAIVSGPSNELVAITSITTQNFNNAHCLLNLCGELNPIFQQFEEVYELYDETHPQKIQQSQTKVQEYKSKGIQISG